jgi:hypothetical protein
LYIEAFLFRGRSIKTDNVFLGITKRLAVESAPPEKANAGLPLEVL